MKHAILKWLLVLLLVILAAVPALYWAVGAWLETAGGRAAVERALEDRLGVPVHLLGDFEVMLWPDIGVSGTRLVIGQPGAATEVARGDEFEVAVALRPLVHRELLIDSIGLSGGAVYPDRLERPAPAEASSSGGFRLPDIASLSIRDLEVGTGGPGSAPVRVRNFEFRGFAVGKETPFSLVVEGFGDFEGRFRWAPGPDRIDLSGAWSGLLPGVLQIDLEAGLDPLSGQLSARSQAPAGPAISVAWRQHAGGWSFTDLKLSAGGQSLSGQGCYYTGPKPSVQLDLSAEALDLAALTGAMPGGRGEKTGDFELPFELRARVHAGQVTVDGGSARNAELTWGGAPDCSALDDAPAAPSPLSKADAGRASADLPVAVPALR